MKRSNVTSRFLVLLALILVLPGLLLVATDTKADKQVTKLVKRGAEVMSLQGTVRRMLDVPQVSFLESTRQMKPVRNFERDRKFTQKSVGEDTVIQLSDTAKAANLTRVPLQMADPYITFEGLDFAGWGAGWPPDTTGDVGLTYYIQAVNTSFGIYRKSDGVRVFASTFNNFFGGPGITGTPCDSNNNGDPIVLYDQYSQRWFILDFAWAPSETDGSYFAIAVSQSSDPLGTWYQYAMRADNVLMNDYPKCGVWHDAIYITANMFNFATSNFIGVKVWALNKANLYSGTLTSQFITDNSYYAWSLLPSHAKGATPPAATTPNYMITMDANEFGGPSADQLVMWEYDVDWANPANTTWTGPTFLPTVAFGLSNGSVPQLGTTRQLDSLAGRLMYPAIYRVFNGHAALYVNHVADVASRRAERWYEVRITGGVPAIYQQGTYAPDTHHRWMGSIGADQDGNIALGYSVSSSTMNPAIRYAAQASIAATAGVLGLGEKVIINGTGSQLSYTRWGDYSTISIDPSDDKTFWYTNEYYVANGNSWHTRIGAFKIKPDLWSKDRPDDIGNEPNTISNPMWISDDIWVRNTNDGFVNQFHENPEYGQTNYLYVRIRNRDSEGSGIDKVYWAFPGTGLNWPTSWNPIGSQATGTLTAGSETILEFPWNPPNPAAYGSSHFCLLSRIETSPIAPYGMTFPETSDINNNVRNNNNIVWKNVTIVDYDPNVPIPPVIISVSNMSRQATTMRLDFVAVPNGNVDAQKDVLQWGKVDVELGDKLFTEWTAAKSAGTGITVSKDRATEINIEAAKANIENIKLEPGEEHLIKFNFTPTAESLTDKNEYILDVIQSTFDGKTYKEVGGVRFLIRPRTIK